VTWLEFSIIQHSEVQALTTEKNNACSENNLHVKLFHVYFDTKSTENRSTTNKRKTPLKEARDDLHS